MPNAPSRICARGHCQIIAVAGTIYCAECSRARHRAKHLKYGTAAQRGYDAQWRSARAAIMNRARNQCEHSGCHVPAVEVHHIVPLAEGGPRLHASNLIALCQDHHRKAHRVLRQKKRGVYIPHNAVKR